MLFFFKHKTAYEIRISDWSSDVCSSDLIKNDAYYALRHQGHPHASAIRAFRDQPPVIHQRTASADLGEYVCDPDELLFPAGSTWPEIEVEICPELSEEAIVTLKPRASEYTVWDNLITRFRVRVRPFGHMTYILK